MSGLLVGEDLMMTWSFLDTDGTAEPSRGRWSHTMIKAGEEKEG